MTGIFILDYFTASPLQAVFVLIAIVIALTVHEFAHAWVAARQGDQTARMFGRVSLNPKAHLDPAGSLLFLFAGIGWGKPVPVNPANLRDGKLGDFYVSIAGIVTNLVVAFIFALPLRIIDLTGGDVTAVNQTWLQFTTIVTDINILLAAFNLLPIPPLDGSKAIGILVPHRFQHAYQEYLRVGPVILIAVFLTAIVFDSRILGTILDPVIGVFGYFVKAFPAGLV
ncbi:MAG TPA: site-2 protease family protein [Patescibacteria group bacterium]